MKTKIHRKGYLRVSIGAPVIGREEERAVLKTIRENRLSQGKYVKKFESAWSSFVGRKFGIAVNSGSSANLIGLLAMKEYYNWKDDDLVLVPALTFATAVMPVIQARLQLIYADVDRRGNIALGNIISAASRHPSAKIKGIVLVHSLGVPCTEVLAIKKWADKNGVRILEDACESHGAQVGRKKVGAFGDISTTSFYVAHNMTTGEGGMVTTNNPKIAEISRSLREFGRHISSDPDERYTRLASGPKYDIRYAFSRLGYNVRMTDIEASIGLVQLAKLDRMNKKRRDIVELYRRQLKDLIASGAISLPEEYKDSYNTYYALQITFEKMPKSCAGSADVAKCLEKAGIETRPFMGGNLLRQLAFLPHGFRPEHYPTAEFLHRRALLVGCHPLINKNHVSHFARTLRQLYV